MPQYSFNQGSLDYLTPAPTTGSTPYGQVPGLTAIPPSVYSQVGSVYPQLETQTGTLGANINSELMGELSPTTIAQLQQHAAQFGVRSGMPLSGFVGNQGLRSLGLNVEATKAQGQKDYLAALQGIGSTMTPQPLAADIAERNAMLAAAPDPTKAAQQQMADWMAKFQMTQAAGRGAGGGGPSGGTMLPRRETPVSSPGQPVIVAPGTGQSPYTVPGTGYYNLPTGNTYGGGAADYMPGWEDYAASAADPWGSFFATGGIPSEGITPEDWAYQPELGYQPTSGGTMYMGEASGYQE